MTDGQPAHSEGCNCHECGRARFDTLTTPEQSSVSWPEGRCDGNCGAGHMKMHQEIANLIRKRDRQSGALHTMEHKISSLKGTVGKLVKELRELRREVPALRDEVTTLRELNPGYEDEPKAQHVP